LARWKNRSANINVFFRRREDKRRTGHGQKDKGGRSGIGRVTWERKKPVDVKQSLGLREWGEALRS